MPRVVLLLVLLLLAPLASALNIAATSTNMAMLSEAVGGEHVSVTVMAPPDRDIHHLDVRPNMMVALRRADIVVSVGAELEVGWLPPAIQSAGNSGINPGRQGYFEAAAQVPLMDQKPDADRSMGDVHPMGNPHVYLDPLRMGDIAEALAARMAALAPEHAAVFKANAAAFRETMVRHAADWRTQAVGAPGVVLFHHDAGYLLRLLDVPVLGYLEPVPGVPPTGRHLNALVSELRGQQGVMIANPWHGSRGPEFIRRELGWPVHVLPTNVPVGGDVDDYVALLQQWVDALASSGAP
ncbi:metal ABC transporter substrate-binding protein [Alcanivorax sp. JB21]|uniref:metal ABC transporter substrate-binding protein n=1 Tax=Alcanivorax limicola TaxID=2874102 RepID=UPI001CC12795|nr:metal ABC transporter substrate-binding protein [Alcanivorax limicola]MBZ2190174.1 metal ABC transporter substrate-binding protein [Alcanivorax limicola]